MEQTDVLFPTPSLSTTKNLGHYLWNIHKKTKSLRDDSWGPPELKGQQRWIPRIFFLSQIFQAWSYAANKSKVATQKHQWAETKKQSALSSQRIRKGAALLDRTLLYNNCSASAKHLRKKTWPHPYPSQQMLTGELKLPLSHWNNAFQHLLLSSHWGSIRRKPNKELEFSSLMEGNESPFSTKNRSVETI